jgi:hypothetical protein
MREMREMRQYGSVSDTLPRKIPPTPLFKGGKNLFYPLFKGVAVGGGILTESYWEMREMREMREK